MSDISLRINHTFMSIPVINSVMGLEPRRAWTAGNPRLAPQSGISTDTYWEYGADMSVDDFIALLESNAGFLGGLAVSGGDMEVVVEAGGKPLANAFDARQLERLKALHLRPGNMATGRRF